MLPLKSPIKHCGQHCLSGNLVPPSLSLQQMHQDYFQDMLLMEIKLNRHQKFQRPWVSPALPGSSPQLWPKLVGFYQVPRNQALSARLMWLLGGELQVYQLNGKLMVRSLIGPLRSNLIRRGPGLSLKPADPNNPLNFTVVAPKLALATPARGTTDISFDPATGTLRIGLVTLESRPWYLSYRYPAMAGIIWFFYNLIGKGRAVDITTQLLILGF